MSTVHLSTPMAPATAACGDANAKRFSPWRWKVTCALCRATTAAVGYETARSADVTYLSGVPIRYSRLVEHVRASAMPGAETAVIEFERDKRIACARACQSCGGDLSDPIALLDVRANRMVFACPACSEQKMRDRWEREGRGITED